MYDETREEVSWGERERSLGLPFLLLLEEVASMHRQRISNVFKLLHTFFSKAGNLLFQAPEILVSQALVDALG